MPHGKQNFSIFFPLKLPTIAMLLKLFSPSLKALNMAVLSAQIVAPNEEDSILHPVKILLVLVIRAAPTENFD